MNRGSTVASSSTTSGSDRASSGKRMKSNFRSIHDDITKSASDVRSYKGMQLNNGMKVMVISDPTTDKAAASMDVNIGSQSDPVELPGLAHFCEHMLFMGTKKYPDEDDYSKYVSQHAGNTNAYTSGDHTNYYFDIRKENFREILDRFSQFFISPLFDSSCSDREVCAVHSEHEKNVMSDSWRFEQLDKQTSDPAHDYFKFGTGNKATLDTIPKQKGLSVRGELLKFHDKFYSANIMALAVLGAEPLDDLTRMVEDMFVDIRNKDVEVPVYDSSPYRPQDLKTITKVVPVKDVRNMVLNFPIPDYTSNYQSSPGHYMGHLIGHEGEGSLFSSLKHRGWVNSLSAGERGGSRGFDFFSIQVDLTEDGMDHINDIVESMFQYINLLRKLGPQQWVYEEIRDIDAMNFRFMDKDKPTSCVLKVAESMQYYPMQDVLSAGNLLTEYNPGLIDDFLSHLVPDKLRLSVVAKSMEAEATQTEPWYGTKYVIKPIDQSLIDKWTSTAPAPEHRLPVRNEFIATNFEIASPADPPSPLPVLLKNTPLSRVWFKQDDKFLLPKAHLKFELFSPIAYISPLNCNMVYMFTELFKDALNEYAYAAELAGLDYKLSNSIYGLQLGVRGYNEKQIVLLEKIFMKMTKFQVDPKRFKIVKEKYGRSLRNFKTDQPYKHSGYFAHAIRAQRAWLKDDLIRTLGELKRDRLETFIGQFMQRLHVEALMHGNLKSQDALNIMSRVETILTSQASTVALPDQERNHEVKLPNESSYVYREQHKVREISAADVYLQVGQQSTDNNMKLRLLAQIISDPCFNILRTKEQLGYIVSSGESFSNGALGLQLLVQSDRSPDYLDGRIEAFVAHIEELLRDMSDEEYDKHVSALVAIILEKPKKLSTEALQHWSEIASAQYVFGRAEIESEHLKTLKKQDVVDFYRRYIRVDAPERSKLAVHVLGKNIERSEFAPGDVSSTPADFLNCPPLKKPTLIEDIAKFKNTVQVYPRVQPHVDISLSKL